MAHRALPKLLVSGLTDVRPPFGSRHIDRRTAQCDRHLGQPRKLGGLDLGDAGAGEVQLAVRAVDVPTGAQCLDAAKRLGGVDVRHGTSVAGRARVSDPRRVTGRRGAPQQQPPLGNNASAGRKPPYLDAVLKCVTSYANRLFAHLRHGGGRAPPDLLLGRLAAIW